MTTPLDRSALVAAGRGARRFPVGTVVVFLVGVALLLFCVTGDRLDETFANGWTGLTVLVTLAGILTLLGGIFVVLYLMRLPSIARARRIEANDPTAVVLIGTTVNELRVVTKRIAKTTKHAVRPPGHYFCFVISQSGLAVRSGRSSSLDQFTWGWDVVQHIAPGIGSDRWSAYDALAVFIRFGRTAVKLPIVASGRGPAGVFVLDADTLSRYAEYCGGFAPHAIADAPSPAQG